MLDAIAGKLTENSDVVPTIKENSAELVLCYKTIYINKFTIFVISLGDGQSHKNKDYNVVLRHESFHIWESHIRGCLLPSNFFLILSKEGTTQLSIGQKD